ncbi:hypothetical protein D9758_003569 [Tetrapyrgos nigripes]|uniref:Uncharacterized protein n=1 Tax=Tetrapyrgos nigripes TaxID=182062 RepID=A0A8H5LWD2_9AGAR|nr:hypothetical protein D9758_003569 [Tetrapyrgos nigripes]
MADAQDGSGQPTNSSNCTQNEQDRPDLTLILSKGQTCTPTKTIREKQATSEDADTNASEANSEQCAVDTLTGELKDTDEIEFYNSESNEIPLNQGNKPLPQVSVQYFLMSKNGTSRSNSFYTGNVMSQRRHLECHHLEDYLQRCRENNVDPKSKKIPESPRVNGCWRSYIPRQTLLYTCPKLMEKDIPHCTTLTATIKDKHQLLIQCNKEIIKNILSLISMTFDGRSKKQHKAFESLTIHFIQAADNNLLEWKLHAHLLTFDHHKGCHTGKENGKHLAKNIPEYGFADKVSWFTSDGVTINAKATCVACKILDPSGKTLKAKECCTNCIEHTFNLMPSHFVQALQIPSIMAIGRGLHDFEVETLLDDLDDDDDEAVEQAMSMEWTPGDIVGKILAFIAQLHQCDAAMDYLEVLCLKHISKPLLMITWVQTCWGSLVMCFKHMIVIREVSDENPDIPLLQDGKLWSNFRLTINEWNVTATRNAILGKEDVATSNWVIPAMHEVTGEWENFLNNDDYTVIAPAIQAGLNNMYKWYCTITEDTTVYFIAHVLDPQQHLTFLEVAWEQSDVEKGLRMMRKVFLEYQAKSQISKLSESAIKEVKQSLSYSSADSYMDMIITAKQKEKSMSNSATSNLALCYEELDKYLYSLSFYLLNGTIAVQRTPILLHPSIDQRPPNFGIFYLASIAR